MKQEQILVVDDEESILESVSFALEHEGYAVRTAEKVSDALDILKDNPFDLVVLDVMLPDRSGLELCRYLHSVGDMPILCLSARDSLEDKVAGLDSGADDYLVKPFKFKELLARVRALLRRGPRRSATETVEFGELRLEPTRRLVTHSGERLHLTLREYELLEYLLRRSRQVITREELLRVLWNLEPPVETNVLEVHISALRSKLGETGRHMIRTVRGVGYSVG